MKAALIVLGIGLAAASHAVLIDGFVDGASDSGYISSALYSSSDPASVPGGIRNVTFSRHANPLADSYRVRVLPSVTTLAVSTGVGLQGQFFIEYGSAASLNANYVANPTFRVTLSQNDLPNPINVRIDSSTFGTTSITLTAVASASPQTLSFNFGSASQLADVDQIYVQSDAQPSADYSFTRIEAVPEPASMAAVALGIVGLVRRRRRF